MTEMHVWSMFKGYLAGFYTYPVATPTITRNLLLERIPASNGVLSIEHIQVKIRNTVPTYLCACIPKVKVEPDLLVLTSGKERMSL